jgi:hypothetical protein
LYKSECDEITRLFNACCDVVGAHDPSSAKNASVPDAKQLGKDIAALQAVIDEIKSRRKQMVSVKTPAL